MPCDQFARRASYEHLGSCADETNAPPTATRCPFTRPKRSCSKSLQDVSFGPPVSTRLTYMTCPISRARRVQTDPVNRSRLLSLGDTALPPTRYRDQRQSNPCALS